MEKKKPKEIIREELQKLSGLTWGQRLGYIWDYYKPLMAAVIALILCISMGIEIYHNARQEELIAAYFINSNSVFADSQAMTDDFAEFIGGVEKNQVINIDTSLSIDEELNEYSTASQTKITALASANALDILVMDEEMFDRYYEQGFFADLGSVLPEEKLEAWSDYLVYREAVSDEEETEKGSEKAADGTKNRASENEGTKEELDASENRIAAAIDLTDVPALQKYSVYTDKKVYGGIFVRAGYEEIFGQFFEFLLQ